MSEVKLEIQVEPLRSRKLMIATPAYGGGIHSMYFKSVFALQKTLIECGIPHQLTTLYNESLISRARNGLAQVFLDSDCTDMIFIDADIEFDPTDVVALMHFDKDMIGAAYPLKKVNWEVIKRVVLANPELPSSELAKYGAFYTSHLFDGGGTLVPFEPIEVEELATGFMMVKKSVFEAIKDKCPEYTPILSGEGAQPKCRDYFQVGVHNGRYESEDYSFCRMWRESGGKIFLAHWMNLTHHGNYPFPGNMKAMADMLGEVH